MKQQVVELESNQIEMFSTDYHKEEDEEDEMDESLEDEQACDEAVED